MSTCTVCGAPLEGSSREPTVCKFCRAVNAPPPTEIEVPVPVQVVHNVVQVVGRAPAEMQELRCPDCKKRLVSAKMDDVVLAGCSRCGGIWLDNASAHVITVKPQRAIAELAKRAGDNALVREQVGRRAGDALTEPRAARVCPVCTVGMDLSRFGRLSLDVCPDHGTWFDRFELGQLVEGLLDPQRAAINCDALVRCSGCGTELRRSTANVTDEGPQCDSCRRALQARQLEAAQAEHTSKGVRELLSALGAALESAAAARRR